MTQRLLVISPVRNESAHIAEVARAVAAQTRPPDAWIVLDDESDDGTLERLRELEREVPFMTVLTVAESLTPGERRDRLARGRCVRNFNTGLRAAPEEDYTHVAKLDGDIELPIRYFELLLDRFEQNPELGLACGDLVEMRAGEWTRIPIPSHHVHGALKCYSRACLNALGGSLPERLAWDTIDETYARMLGFRTQSFADLVAIHRRPVGSADGTLRGRARHGRCAYIAHFGFPWVALRSVKLALAPPRGASGVAFLYGYVAAAARSEPRVEDEAFRRFVHRELRARMRGALGRRPYAHPRVGPEPSVPVPAELRNS